MVANLTEEISFGGRTFRFELCRKTEQMGEVPVDHWWMDTRGLYGQRGRESPNRAAVTDYYWALCHEYGTSGDAPVQESFILAKILPQARSNAARAIFADANPIPPVGRKRLQAEAAEALEQTLLASRYEHMTWSEFEQKTQDLLGPPPLSKDAVGLYGAFTDELFGEARSAIEHRGLEGLDGAQRRWSEAIRRWGRRSGFAREKQVLDVLSYEARAALHRCYSATWVELLACLSEKYQLSPPSRKFLELWHLDQIRERGPADGEAWDHLFHGHVFALHPIGGGLLRTSTGRQLVGKWLSDPDSQAAFGRVLHALCAAAYHYDERRESQSFERRQRLLTGGGTGTILSQGSGPDARQSRRGRRRSKGGR
jgi:hypothetical protein